MQCLCISFYKGQNADSVGAYRCCSFVLRDALRLTDMFRPLEQWSVRYRRYARRYHLDCILYGLHSLRNQ